MQTEQLLRGFSFNKNCKKTNFLISTRMEKPLNSVNATCCNTVDVYVFLVHIILLLMCDKISHHVAFILINQCHRISCQVKFLSVSLFPTLLHVYKWTAIQIIKQKHSHRLTVKFRRLTSLYKGQAFWLFEGRIGLGSFKLTNNISANRSTVPAYHCVPNKSGLHNRVDVDPSPGWVTSWNKCSYATI